MMNVTVYCTNCKDEIHIFDAFNQLGKDVECDNCGHISELKYEEGYDEEGEIMMFWLE